MRTSLTLLWTEALAADLQMLRDCAARAGGAVEQTPRAALPMRIATAIQHGAVVVLAGSDVEASIALRSGADEVVRTGELTETSLARAIESATLRSASRAAPVSPDGGFGSQLLASALTAELNVPLSSAVLDCDVLWDALGRVLYATERLADWGSLNAPIEQLRELVALRASAPSSVELQARVEKLRSSLARAGAVVRTFNALTVETDGADTRVDEVAASVAEMLRAHVQVVGELTLTVARCHTSAPRATVVHVLTGMLANAIGTLYAAGRTTGGHITLDVFEAEGAVVIEVHDDAPPSFQIPLAAPSAALHDVRSRARGAGGDFFLDEDSGGKTARVVLPASDGLNVVEPRVSGTSTRVFS